MTKKFAVSGQHYLFDVQSFAAVVLSLGGDAYEYALRDRTTKRVIEDVANGESEIGVLVETTRSKDGLEEAFAEAGVEFVELIESTPRVALPKSHPFVNAESLTLDQLEDFPYIYFEQEEGAPAYFAEEALFPYVYFDQGEDAPIAFYEEALSQVPRAKKVACTDRASLTELIMAINGYTVTSGILVGISDGSSLATVRLDTDVTLHLGYIVKKGVELSEAGKKFVEKLEGNLRKYAKF